MVKKGGPRHSAAHAPEPEGPEAERLRQEEKALRETYLIKKLREQHDQEQKLSRQSLALKTAEWRAKLRATKAKELSQEIDILAQTHSRQVDRRDAVVEMLDRDLDEVENQYQMALRSHIKNVDNLIEIQNQRLQMLEEELEDDMDQLEKEFSTERTEIIEQHRVKKEELQKIKRAIEEQYLAQCTREREAWAKELSDLSQKLDGDRSTLKTRLQEDLGYWTDRMGKLHHDYTMNTSALFDNFSKDSLNEQKSAKDIKKYLLQIRLNQEKLNALKTKILNNKREFEERKASLTEEKEAVTRHYEDLKRRMLRFRSAEHDRLKELTISSREVIKELNDKLAMASRILKAGELNRKLETEREKVLPFFPTASEDPDIQQEIQQRLQQVAVELGEDPHERPEWNLLTNFYKRFNKVMLDKVAMQREFERLQKENQDLRTILKRYLDGISVNEAVMTQSNPLMIVNGS
ncbi:putative flagellar associated protein [Paratrimastix pyriformis]|uniref:Dynein regulatory complex subunit 2 n=1 Tax=Paratrimastix pyriformis TaxID=342808 RepID=A0ABQ8UK17_9EUKA|nr:putative flagellar associated protein [Paratrimastix pyriformis]